MAKSTEEQIKDIFQKTEKIKCPAFPKEEINFNAKGVNHLIYKGPRSKRDAARIKVNLRLLPGAIKLLKIMPIAQEENSRIGPDGREYKYWAFEGVIDNRRIKVVIRQIGNGAKHFYSVIPCWRRDRFGNVFNAKEDLSKI